MFTPSQKTIQDFDQIVKMYQALGIETTVKAECNHFIDNYLGDFTGKQLADYSYCKDAVQAYIYDKQIDDTKSNQILDCFKVEAQARLEDGLSKGLSFLKLTTITKNLQICLFLDFGNQIISELKEAN